MEARLRMTTRNMTPVYIIAGQYPPVWPVMLSHGDTIRPNHWSLEFLSRAQFEDAQHVLTAHDDDYNPRTSDEGADISPVGTALWALSEKAWDWLPALEASGCRIAHRVRVAQGTKNYKLIHSAPVLDLLDHGNTELTINDVSGTISWIRKAHLYEWDGDPPLMFHALMHHPKEYRGTKVSASKWTFVSQAFADELKRRGLTGVNLYPVPRTAPPPGGLGPVVVYTPAKAPET